MEPISGERIRSAREDAGLTRDWVAMQMGVAERTVRRWEEGETGPEGDARQALAHFLRTPVHQLWTPEENLAALGDRAQRLLLGATARGHSDGLYFLTFDARSRRAAHELWRLWLVKDNGPRHGDQSRLWWVTPAGEDVLDLLQGRHRFARQPDPEAEVIAEAPGDARGRLAANGA
jgi:transcriptional regulator with XRE-family HTH domain